MKNENYINIQGWMITQLGLTGNELVLFAVIYGFSQDGKSKYRGSFSYIQTALRLSKNTVVRNLDGLIEKGLIEKTVSSTGNLYSAKMAQVDDEVVPKRDRGSAKMAQVSSAKMAHNNNNINNKDNNNKGDGIAYIIKLFEKLDVKNKKYYGHKTQRANAKILLEEYGIERISKVIDVYLKAKGDKFLPSISSPYDMVEKWSKLEDYFIRLKADADKREEESSY